MENLHTRTHACAFANRIWTPRFWTSAGSVSFNFTGFMDYQSGVARYAWGLGSAPFAADVVPLGELRELRVLKDIKYSGGTKKMFVTVVVSCRAGRGLRRDWTAVQLLARVTAAAGAQDTGNHVPHWRRCGDVTHAGMRGSCTSRACAACHAPS